MNECCVCVCILGGVVLSRMCADCNKWLVFACMIERGWVCGRGVVAGLPQ